MKELESLDELQQVDLALDEHKRRLVQSPELQELKELEKEFVQLTAGLKKAQGELEDEVIKQKKLEGEIELLDLKIKKEEKSLFSGQVVNPKELTGLQAEIKMLTNQKDEKETELLEQLETVEESTGKAEDLKNSLTKVTAGLQEAKKKYQLMIQESGVEITRLEKQRSELEPKISKDLLGKYQKLRESKLAKAVVPLLDETCQGCFVTVAAEEVDRMLSQDKIWHCPNCRRILIIKSQ